MTNVWNQEKGLNQEVCPNPEKQCLSPKENCGKQDEAGVKQSPEHLNFVGVAVDSPFFLAPLAGVTDSSFRRVCKELGAGLVYSEMISGKGLCYNDKGTEKLLALYDGELPAAYQIFGSDPAVMEQTAIALSNRKNALLDINMGCPVPKVVKNGEGSALMKNPALAADVIRAVIRGEQKAADRQSRQPKPVTVKCRIGWDSERINGVEFAKTAEEAGAAAITVHGRTREQFYSGEADWEMIARIKEAVQIPVVGNGDVFSGGDASRLMKQTGCDFVMIARGALGNPWIFREAKALWQGHPVPVRPDVTQRMALVQKQFQMLLEEKGEYAAVREMRKHMGWYLKGIHGAARLRQKINTIEQAQELQRWIGQIGQQE